MSKCFVKQNALFGGVGKIKKYLQTIEFSPHKLIGLNQVRKPLVFHLIQIFK
jgi:hypothetical protein